jgi:lipopolysaccharide/colanic/teichoic acid biosynthesis glycosyltransferase
VKLGGLLIAIAGGLLVHEIRAWAPDAARRVVAMAVRLLPRSQRDRYREEWLEQIESLISSDRSISGLLLVLKWALGTLPASSRMALGERRGQFAVKRLMDIAGSLMMLITLTPLMLAIGIVIRLTSPGPIIYAQRRIGKGGHPFTMYKFRSMDREAHDLRYLHAHRNRPTTGPVFKVPDDPRVTRVGRVIRRLSLDELPQLLNVLRGDMSLVGPRPALPEEYALCDDFVRQRTQVKPGLTCTWQISGRSDVDFLRWVDMDLQYIQEWSLRVDLSLLLRTIPAVFRGYGAY